MNLSAYTTRFTGFGYPRYFMAGDFCACVQTDCKLLRGIV